MEATNYQPEMPHRDGQTKPKKGRKKVVKKVKKFYKKSTKKGTRNSSKKGCQKRLKSPKSR